MAAKPAQQDMKGQTVLITGGTGGIGYQTARALASSGARVVITGRDTARGQDAAAAIRRAKPAPSRLATLAPTRSIVAEARVGSSRVASCSVRELSARVMIGQVVSRNVSAAASQPPIRATAGVANCRRAMATIRPMANTTRARRRSEACQPSHRWYSVCAGMPFII
jgi:NAD(P)-dependent dehydrogenase (short-subunit alcohol dehydrogenase family)